MGRQASKSVANANEVTYYFAIFFVQVTSSPLSISNLEVLNWIRKSMKNQRWKPIYIHSMSLTMNAITRGIWKQCKMAAKPIKISQAYFPLPLNLIRKGFLALTG